MKKNNIVFTKNIKLEISLFIERKKISKIFILLDENTQNKCFPLVKEIFSSAKIIVIKSGEENKNIVALATIWNFLSDNGADRHSLLINIGGGMLTDVGGFAASCFKRGIHFINVPTTLLSQVDASIGGKTGINFNGLKNEIGVFNTPECVIIDTIFLKTLDKSEILSGIGEMIKHGLIYDKKHFEKTCNIDINNINYTELLDLIKESVEIKKHFVENDYTENGIRKALNFGHTIGHALESFAIEKGYEVKHGEMVAYGITVELLLSNIKLGFDIESVHSINKYLYETFPFYEFYKEEIPYLIELMRHDKKNSEGKINFTLLEDIGKFKIDIFVEEKEIAKALSILTDN